jgi:glycosyltransferase involved in cell wall biosynthesis
LLNLVDGYNADLVHLQYPTLGFGYKLGPQLIALARRTVVTVHEASQAHWLRRVSLYGFSVRPKKIIFTSRWERDYAVRWCPWIGRSTGIIPIGANVPVSVISFAEKEDAVGYFGLLRPNKGIELVIGAAQILQAKESSLRVRIMGKIVPGLERYYDELRQRANGLPIDWFINVEGDALAQLIGSCKFAYLPFPDGASERRASLIAFMSAGACIVSTRGEQTPSYMDSALIFSDGFELAVEDIEKLFQDRDRSLLLQEESKRVARRFSWSDIAMRHEEMYLSVIGR